MKETRYITETIYAPRRKSSSGSLENGLAKLGLAFAERKDGRLQYRSGNGTLKNSKPAERLLSLFENDIGHYYELMQICSGEPPFVGTFDPLADRDDNLKLSVWLICLNDVENICCEGMVGWDPVRVAVDSRAAQLVRKDFAVLHVVKALKESGVKDVRYGCVLRDRKGLIRADIVYQRKPGDKVRFVNVYPNKSKLYSADLKGDSQRLRGLNIVTHEGPARGDIHMDAFAKTIITYNEDDYKYISFYELDELP